ncbi:hypothetical protein CJ030_MR2G000503 [Morella rubra]|uniref:GRF-type domain-containing protein n=1 Tax=Morella rubra TaxID=262757 RepID=A0A6A1WG68_9ROSI|nr:hypothetical protein CJ030_MR2G000503 [Morella rubra]
MASNRSGSTCTGGNGSSFRYPMCDCSVQASLKTTYTEGNFGRRFFACVNHKYGRSCNFFNWYDPPMCSYGRRVLRHLREKHERANMKATSSVATTEPNIASNTHPWFLKWPWLKWQKYMESMKSKHQEELRCEMESMKSKHQQERHYYRKALVLSWAFFSVCIILGFLGGSPSNEKPALT